MPASGIWTAFDVVAYHVLILYPLYPRPYEI